MSTASPSSAGAGAGSPTVVSVAAVSRGGLLGGQGRGRLGAGGAAPLLRVGRARRSPSAQCREPRARKGRPQGVPKGREYRTERSEGGTDRPCRARGGTRLGGPDGTPFHPWPDTLPPTTSGRDSCGIQGAAGRGHRPGIRQGKEPGIRQGKEDGEAAVIAAVELHGDLVDGRLAP